MAQSTWDYRVVHEARRDGDEYTIREIYTDTVLINNKPEHKIVAHTDCPVFPLGGTLQELSEDLEHMKEALRKPVLEMGDLEKLKGRKVGDAG